jgi:hypothetical protein
LEPRRSEAFQRLHDLDRSPFPFLRRTIVKASCHKALSSKRSWGLGTSVLISILITFLVIVLVLYLIARLPIDGRAKQIARIIVILIGIISLLKYLAVF